MGEQRIAQLEFNVVMVDSFSKGNRSLAQIQQSSKFDSNAMGFETSFAER